MSRSAAPSPSIGRNGEPWLAAALALTLAVGAGVLLAQLTMSPPSNELREMAAYLTIAGAGTMLAGWLAIRLLAGAAGLNIRAKTFIGAITGSGIALLNVVIVAQLMFISTSHDLNVLLALVAFSGVVTVCFTMWVASMITARIEAVADGIRALAGGAYASRVAIDGRDEVGALARDVNALAARLQQGEEERQALDRERRDLTAAISHDLRTPLSSIRAMVEALHDGIVDDPGEVSRYYATMRREVDRLSRMIDDLFELARIDSGAFQLDRRPLYLQEIVSEVVDAMQARARSKSVEIRVEGGSAPQMLLDGARTERAIANLLQNALDHTPRDGLISVGIRCVNSSIELTVADTGPGIDEADLQLIWQRFFRADRSRNHDSSTDGAGLGLAIVRGIVEAHGGSVHARSEPGHGATFTLCLPASNQRSASASTPMDPQPPT